MLLQVCLKLYNDSNRVAFLSRGGKMKKKEMTKEEIAKAKRRLKVLERLLSKAPPLMRGSIVTNGVKQKRLCFSLTKDKRTHLMYLGEGRLEKAKVLSANYGKLQEIVEEMTFLNMALLKNNALD